MITLLEIIFRGAQRGACQQIMLTSKKGGVSPLISANLFPNLHRQSPKEPATMFQQHTRRVQNKKKSPKREDRERKKCVCLLLAKAGIHQYIRTYLYENPWGSDSET